MGAPHTRYVLSKRDRRRLAEELGSALGRGAAALVAGSDRVEVVRAGDTDIYLVDGTPAFFRRGERLYPTVLALHGGLLRVPLVVVDMGAVPHILNGADVMAPGIVRVEGELSEGAVVAVADEQKLRPFAVGEVMEGFRDALAARRGKVVRNVHYAGDKLWKLYRGLTRP